MANNRLVGAGNGLVPDTLADGSPNTDANAGYQQAYGAATEWLQQQRAQSVAMGLLDPNTGLPTAAGLKAAAQEYANGLLMGTTAPTKNPNFANWFGGSKVVDKAGEPLVVYHGTANDFAAFQPGHPGAHLALPGHFFTPDPKLASAFARSSAMDKAFKSGRQVDPDAPYGAQVIPAHLSIQNPYHIDASGGSFDGHVPASLIKSMLERAKEQGHDGAIIEGWKDGSGPIQYVAFSPEQIKSAIGNRGTFDPTDPRITYGAGAIGLGTAAAAAQDNSGQ